MGYEYQFPEVNNKGFLPHEQVEKIKEEFEEFYDASYSSEESKGVLAKVTYNSVDECFDIIQACETYLHIASRLFDIQDIFRDVMLDNASKGYYCSDDPCKFDASKVKFIEDTRFDSIKRPSHYAVNGMEAKDVFDKLQAGSEEFGMRLVWWFQAFRYLWRWPRKNGAQDVRKCIECCELLLKEIESGEEE